MKRTIFILSTVLPGFLGGFTCNYLMNGFTASAQSGQQQPRRESSSTNPIHARGFILENANGEKRGELSLDSKGNGSLKLYSPTGKLAWSSPASGVLPLDARPESLR